MRQIRNKFKLYIGLGLLTLSGCVAVPQIQEHPLFEISLNNHEVISDNWWAKFQDPYLNQLINNVYQKNNDLTLATLDFQKAVENSGLAKSQSTASYSLDYSFERERLSEFGLVIPPYGGAIINQNNLAFSVNYPIDLLGKYDALIKSKEYLVEGEVLKANYLKISLSTQTVKLYGYAQYLKNKNTILNNQNKILNILVNDEIEKVKLGSSIQENVLSLNNQILLNNNLIEQNQKDYDITINSIKKLLGTTQAPPIVFSIQNIYQHPIQPLVKTIKVNSIATRPDIAYYLKLIASSKSNLKYLKTGFYPNITLSGSAGFQSIQISDLLKPGSFIFNFGPALNIPIFNEGVLKSNYRLAGLDLNTFIEQYNQSLNNAFYDVNNKLLTNKNDYQNYLNQTSIFSNNQQTWTNAQSRFSLGTISHGTLLQNQFNFLQAQSDLLDSQWQYFGTNIDVIGAIGGVLPKEELAKK